MTKGWKKYFWYACAIISAGILIFLLVSTVILKNTGFEGKTLWDWMELLIIPLVLALGAFYLNRSEKELERKGAEDRAKLEREIATDRQQEAALQGYLDRMGELLLEKGLRMAENDEVRNVARTRTLTILRGLDATRKGMVVKFLNEAELIDREKAVVELRGADLHLCDLEYADLINADLEKTDLDHANLKGAYLVNANLYLSKLKAADLEHAKLMKAILEYANLVDAKLNGANLEWANLMNADLGHANLVNAMLMEANLVGANLMGANLVGASLMDANLDGANLMDANLVGASVTAEQLATAKSLRGATMPDGTIHE